MKVIAELEAATNFMIERCNYCGKDHETGGEMSFCDMPIKECPDVPEDMGLFIPPTGLKYHVANARHFQCFCGECGLDACQYCPKTLILFNGCPPLLSNVPLS